MSRRRRLADDVPRIPRGRGFTLSTAQLVRIVMVATALIALLVLQKPCARATSRFVTSFEFHDAGVVPSDAAPAVVPDGVILRGTMTRAEIEAAVAAERARAAAATVDAGVAAPLDAAGATPPR